MTPSQAYAQWKQYAADPADSEAQSIQKFSRQFGIAPEQEEELYEAYPDQPKFRAPRESGFLAQTFGAGMDELQKSAGSAIAGPGAELLSDMGWEGGAGFLEDIGSDIVRQQDEDLQAYEAPQTRDELIKEGGVWGSLYEHVLPEETQTPQQLGRSALPSLGAAGIALGAAGVAALASGGNPFIVGATAMAVGNAVGSFQVGGEEFENAKRDPFIRKQLGINPDANFEDLAPDQQRSLTDSAQRVAKDTMVERLYTSGALESLAFIPYGSLALRYIADIGLGATSEELDKRLGMENTLEELQRLGVTREEVPELREKIKGMRPGTFETVWNAAIMEATFGAPTAVIETIAQPDSRVDRRATAESEKRKILKQRIKEAQADPFKIEMAEKKLVDQDVTTQIKLQKESDRRRDQRNKEIDDAKQRVEARKKQVMEELDRRTGEDSMGRPFESSGVNGIPDTVWKKYRDGDSEAIDAFFRQELEQVTARAEANANEEAGKPSETSSFTRTESKKKDVDDTGINEALDDVQPGKAIDSREADPNERLISMDRIMQQIAIDEFNTAFPEINFRASTLIKDKDGRGAIVYEDEDGNLQRDYDWQRLEGFVEDKQINEGVESPYVFLTQSMYNDQGQLITDTKEALDRMVEVAFHESIGHVGLRRMLNAGEMIDAVKDENGNITNKNEYQRWTGEDYNKFIDGFRNRHQKMINRWMKGDGNSYSEETTFRQTEEFIARHFGEAGGKPVGFFDNMAILLREINPFIGNSLNQYQVAKQIQLVADEYATGITGDAPKKKNILSGVELVGAISRAATEAGVEKEVETPTEIVLSRKQKAKKEKEALQLTATAGIGRKVPDTIDQKEAKKAAAEVARTEEKKEIEKFEEAALKKAEGLREEQTRTEAREQEKKIFEDTKTSTKPRTTPEVLAELAKSENKTIRINVAEHENTSNETLKMLSGPKNKDSQGTITAALKAIKKRKGEVKTWKGKVKTQKENLAKAEKVVADLSKIESKDRKKSEKNKLRKNKKLVTALSKEIPAPKHFIPPKTKKSTTKSKRSIPTDAMGYKELRDVERVSGTDTSLTTFGLAGRSVEDKQIPELLRKKGYREGIPITEQKGPVIAEIEDLMLGASEKGRKPKKDQYGKQIRAKLSPVLNRKIAKIRRDKIKELAKAKTELNKLLSTTPKTSNPKEHWAKIKPAVEKLRGKIGELTEGRDLTKKEAKESKFMENLRARPWEFFGVGLFLSQDDRSLSLIKPLKKTGKTEYSLSAEEVVDIDILEAGVAIESLRVDLNNSLLALKGDEEWKPRGKKALREGIKSSEKKIKKLGEGRVEHQKDIEGKIQHAFDNILDEKERAALIYDMGMSKEYGMMDQSQIAALMKEEGITTSEGRAPRQQWVSKQIISAIEKIRESMGYETNKTEPPGKGKSYEELMENYGHVKPWLKDVLKKYPKTTGEKSKRGKALAKEVAKEDAEIKRRWDELLTGRLGLGKGGNVPKGIRLERKEAATALYKDTGLITKPSSMENWKAWGDISDEDMAYLKEAAGKPRSKDYEWKMIRPPVGTDVVSEDILGEVDPVTDEVKETMDELMDVQFDAIDKDPVLFEKAIKDMSKENLKGLSDAYLRKVDPKSRSKRSIRGFGGKSAKIDRNIKEKILASDVMKSLRYFMTPTELESLTKETIDAIVTLSTKGKTRTGKNITITKLNKAGTPRLTRESLAAMAYAGRFKKGWYRHGARQLKKVFLTDTNRFIALLAATSPQTSVEMNLENSLRIWNNWEKAGRPIEAKEIKQIMGRSVVGKGTEESVMDAWVNNSITALSASDPTKIELSGPKADSFMQNLLENLDEVTLDTWQGRAYNLLQDVFGGIQRKATEGRGVKSPGYILSAAKTREAAAFLSKKTGTKWEPAEIQETIWSFVKALYEKRKSPAGRTTPMDSLFLTLSQNEIANVPDFASLISTNKYGSILNEGKYGKRISSVKKFQTSAEAIATPSYRGLEATLNRITGELESQFRTTNTSRVTKGIRDKIHRGVVADRDGTGGGKRAFIRRSARNPGGKLTGLGKLTKYNLTELDRKRLNSLGVSTPEFFELPKSSETGRIFQEAIEASKKEHPHGAAVYVYTPDEYSTFKNFLTKDGKTGFSIKPNGDIVSVFNTPTTGKTAVPYFGKKSTRPAASLTSLMLAVENGGTKLDAFDTLLPRLYSRAGFRISSRMAWNDEFAPANWDKKAFSKYNKGEPDVVFMHYDPDSTEVYNAPIGKRKKKEKTGRESILFDDYDAAVNLQTRNVEESQGRFKKAKRIPGKQAERMGHKIPKAPWKVEERSLVPAVAKTITDPNFRVMPASKSKRSKSEVSRSTFSAGADQRFGSKWTNFWLRQINKLKPLSKLDPDSKKFYLQLRQVAFGQLAQWEFFSNSVFKALKDSKQSKEIYKYLTTPNANSSIISDPNERVHAEKAKRAIEKIGETLVSKKLMKETTLRDFKKKHGDYLPRVYLRHLLNEGDRTAIARGLKPSNLDYLKQRRDIPKGIRELILGQLTDQQGAPALLASRALMVPGKDLAIMNWMQKMKDLSTSKNLGWVIPNQFVKFNTLEEARNIAKDLNLNSAVIKELELDIDFSDMSTEVTPAWLAAESDKLRLMSHDLQGDRKKIVKELYRKMYEEAKKMEPMFGEKAKIDNFRKLPNSARYGAMRGMWIHKQIADDIIGGMKLATGDESNWEKIVGETGMMGKYNAYWKWAKVAGNPPSWARNYISNNILLTLAGIPFWSIPRLNLAAMKEIRTKGKYYQIALKQGVMAGNMSNAELGRMESDFLQIERNMSDSGNPLSFLGTRVHAGVGKVMETTSNIYGGIETLGKIGAIKYAMEQKNMNESEAAAFANKWLFDYGLVTPSVRYASTAVVGAPFIRFQSHAIPLMLEVGLTKPWRFLPYYALGYGMIEMFKNSHDIDEEEYESIKKALAPWLQEKALNPKLPGTNIPLLPPNVLPMPYLDKQGRWQIHDVSYLMPWGMMTEVAGETLKGQFSDAMKSLGLMGGPLADAMVVIKTGVDPFTRRPITDDTKPYIDQAGDYIKYIYNMSMPSMFHTSHGAVNRIWDSAMGNLDPKTGELKYEPLQAWLRLGGQNIYPTNLVEQRRTNIRRMKWEMGNLKSAHKRRLRGLLRSKASREEIAEAREEYREQLKERREEIIDYTRKSKVPRSLRAG